VAVRGEVVEKTPPEIEIPAPSQPAESRRSWFPRVRRRVRLQLLALIPLVVAAFWVTANRFQQPLRVVVLPFENRGTPEGDDAYLAAGLTDEITNALGSIPSFQVVSPPGKLAQGQGMASEVGRQLKVR